MANVLRLVLISFATSAFRLLYETCKNAGHLPVAMVHARSLRQNRPTSKPSAAAIEAIAESLPPGMDLLLPGTTDGLARMLAGYQADLIVTYGFPWKLPPEVRRSVRLGAINVHPSLLPKYRGPIPVHWAVRNGDPEVGVTIHWMNDDFDSGNILVQRGGIRIDEDLVTATLWRDVDDLIEELLVPALNLAAVGAPGDPQSDRDASYAGWMEPDFMFVNPARGVRETHNQVRAFRFNLFGLRGPYVKIGNKWLTALRTSVHPANGLRFDCADGPIWVTESVDAVPPDR
ncbi:methionyl-tRNA formyltransferase [Acrocarpospora catenulata]|uniref:methionyl-tRNA formyltransferase n=1 Tax=Acrocarpospora catenulata TaxID=2836182 RepID=UPI001BDA03BB|nr:formyltransferase family protein [Acrocarpospora catenulata]